MSHDQTESRQAGMFSLLRNAALRKGKDIWILFFPKQFHNSPMLLITELSIK